MHDQLASSFPTCASEVHLSIKPIQQVLCREATDSKEQLKVDDGQTNQDAVTLRQ